MRVTPIQGCITAELGETTVVLNPDMDYVELDPVGATIWARLQTESDVERIADTLVDVFDADQAVLLRDVQAYVEKLQAVGLVALDPS